jgi:hypothetical protein
VEVFDPASTRLYLVSWASVWSTLCNLGADRKGITVNVFVPIRFHENLINEPLRSSGWFLDAINDWHVGGMMPLTAREPMDVGASVVLADWPALASL